MRFITKERGAAFTMEAKHIRNQVAGEFSLSEFKINRQDTELFHQIITGLGLSQHGRQREYW